MKEIKLNETSSIYVNQLVNYNSDILKNELRKNFEFNYGSENSELMLSGEQSLLLIESNEINKIKNQCINTIKSIIKQSDNIVYYTKNWIYVNNSKTKEAFYHEHSQNKDVSILKNEWVYTFYVQMPNNLSGDEGYLLFKTNDGAINKILPKEGEVVIFPADLLHKPELSPNTTKERIVFSGVFSTVDMNRSYIKSTKTVF